MITASVLKGLRYLVKTQLYDVRNQIGQRRPENNVKYLLRVALKLEIIVNLILGRKKKRGLRYKNWSWFNSSSQRSQSYRNQSIDMWNENMVGTLVIKDLNANAKPA